MKNRWFVNLFVAFTKITGFLPTLILFKPKIYRVNKKNKKFPKPCIFVSNHKSLLDFVLYLLIFPFRTIHFLMAEVLYKKGKLFSFMLNSLGGIKVDRDDKEFGFVSRAIEVLDHNGVVGIFPEARLPINGKPWPFTTSTAFIASHASAPILPVYTDGNYGIFKRAKVCIGEPFYLSDYEQEGLTQEEQLAHLTKVLEEKVYELKTFMERSEDKNAPKSGRRKWSIRRLPMDMARLVCTVLVPILRVKRITPEGQKYKNKVRGGAIVAANHTSFADPFIVGITFWYRRMHFLVAEIVMKGKLRSTLLKGVGAIKIDRNTTDIDAINKSIEKLQQGFLLSVFPQGGINASDEIDAIKSGVVLMAIRAKVNIIPMHILPRKRWYHARTVVIGNPVNPADYCTRKLPSTADIKTISEQLIKELNRCKNANTATVTG